MKKVWQIFGVAATCAMVTAAGVKVSVQFDKANAAMPQTPATATLAKVPADLAGAGASNFKKLQHWQSAASAEDSGQFSVFADQSSNWALTIAYTDGTTKVLPTPTPVVYPLPIPGTNKIAFSGLGNNQAPYPMYVIDTDGTGLHKIGGTETPWRFQTTTRGLVAFREGRSLVTYDTVSRDRTVLPGVELTGTYPIDDTLWAVSPDASNVALRQGDNLQLLDMKAGTQRTVAGPLDRRRETVGMWSPDGSSFAYATDPRAAGEQPTVWTVTPTTEAQSIFKYPNQNKGMFWKMAWIDGKTLAVNFVPNGPMATAVPSTEYFMVSTLGGGRLLFTNGLGLKVTGDGKKLFVERQNTVDSITDFALWQADILH